MHNLDQWKRSLQIEILHTFKAPGSSCFSCLQLRRFWGPKPFCIFFDFVLPFYIQKCRSVKIFKRSLKGTTHFFWINMKEREKEPNIHASPRLCELVFFQDLSHDLVIAIFLVVSDGPIDNKAYVVTSSISKSAVLFLQSC